MNSKQEGPICSRTNPRARLAQLQSQYQKRRAAETMSETKPSDELALEGFEIAQERIGALEEENKELRRILSLIKEQADAVPECGTIRALLRKVPDA